MTDTTGTTGKSKNYFLRVRMRITINLRLYDLELLKERGAAGVRDVLEAMTKQLQGMMNRTASKDLKHIAPSVIWER